MRVVVTGGRGNLGREVMRALTERGHQPVNASRRSGVDVRSGAGLDAVLKRADAVVHTADTLRPWEFRAVTLGGTQRLADALAALDRRVPLVYISIVGVDRSPYAYYRMKHAAELAIRERPIAATVVRATQFHSLAAAMVGMRPGPRSRIFNNDGTPSSVTLPHTKPSPSLTRGYPTGCRGTLHAASTETVSPSRSSD